MRARCLAIAVVSASPQKRTNQRSFPHVRFVPEAAVSNRSKKVALFDHLVGTGEQSWRNGEAESRRRLEIDHEFDLRRLLSGSSAGCAPFRILST
jgi:hypothetical protein